MCTTVSDLWVKFPGGGGQLVGQIEGFSHESEHDLAAMVSDFLENGSSGAESWCSSDSDSSFSDIAHLADKISFHRRLMDQYQRDLLSVVHALMLSIKEVDLQPIKLATCNSSCIRSLLVKLLRISGYDAAVCASRWQNVGKVPRGDHEYIDVINYHEDGSSERLIIDIDFRSHFEIARPVESYERLLSSLPVVYVGNLSKLKQLLRVMVDAAKSSLKQNSMPLPPWRSLAYLQAKWLSPYQRLLSSDEPNTGRSSHCERQTQCGGHLRTLQYSLRSEIEAEQLLKPIDNDTKRRLKLERRKRSSLRTH